MDGLSIRQAIEKVLSGSIRIPAFQRGFVWDADLVAHFMDSIYKGYPFGALILWRTKNQLKAERELGPFVLPERDPDYPIDYVLDGQQRLTSIFGVFQTDLEQAGEIDWNKIYFDIEATRELQESWFSALHDSEVDTARHFPIGTFFDTVAYRKATQALDETAAKRIDQVQAVFKEARLPVQSLETDDRSKVAIVFERVNRLGVELDVFMLLSAWTWSEDFDLQSEFANFSAELEEFGFSDIGDDTNLLLRCCASVVAEDPAPSAVIGLSGSEVRERFDEIKNGIRGAIDFLRINLGVESLQNLPYPTLLVPLTVFFAVPKTRSSKLSSMQRRELISWFWKSCFSRRFSAGVLTNLRRDISAARDLRDSGNPGLASITVSLDVDYFSDNRFKISTVNTKAFVLLLAQFGPRSFVSGNPIKLHDVLMAYNRREFHHCFPRAFLSGQDREADEINLLANFVFLSAQDNKTLGGVAPSEYRQKMDPAHVPSILETALCPDSLFGDDYDYFIKERSERLLDAAKKMMA